MDHVSHLRIRIYPFEDNGRIAYFCVDLICRIYPEDTSKATTMRVLHTRSEARRIGNAIATRFMIPVTDEL
jgi:hypothetical protein